MSDPDDKKTSSPRKGSMFSQPLQPIPIVEHQVLVQCSSAPVLDEAGLTKRRCSKDAPMWFSDDGISPFVPSISEIHPVTVDKLLTTTPACAVPREHGVSQSEAETSTSEAHSKLDQHSMDSPMEFQRDYTLTGVHKPHRTGWSCVLL